MNELHIYPTSRAIRQAYELQKSNSGFMPSLMRMDEFESRSIVVENKKQVDKLERIFLLKEALNEKSIETLKIDTSLIRFFTKSDAIFKFFEELSGEHVDFNTLRNADAYAEFEEHIELLETIYVNYKYILEQKGLYDKAFIPQIYLLNQGFISGFSKIKIHLEGYLSRFELKLIENISQIVNVEVEYVTSDFNYKMQERFKEYGIELPNSKNVIFDFTNKTVLDAIEEEFKVNSKVYSVSQRTEQVAVALEEVNNMVNSGISPEKIVVVVPDENIKEYFMAYNKSNNLNFSMGYNYSNSAPFRILEATYNYWNDYSIENLNQIEFYGVDISKVDISLSNNIINIEEFFLYLDSLNVLEELESNSEVLTIKLRFQRVFEAEKFILKQWLFLWLQLLQDVSIDDINGGLITVMGVLETRGIDFDGVVVVDFNEGIVPSIVNKDQFLNSAVREFASLPTLKDREALQKQYYSRLLKSAKTSSIVYVSSENKLPSKFLFELGLQRGMAYNVARNLLYDNSNIVEGEDPVVDSFDAIGMSWSASRLSTYLRCKRKFYYKYIAQIKAKDSDELNEGEFLHKVLENVHAKTYKTSQDLHIAIAKEIDMLLDSDDAVSNYKKMLFKEKLKGYVAWSMNHFKDGWEIVSREKEYRAKIGGLTFNGRVDRIDTNDFKTLVIDYKSGNIPKDKKEFNEDDQKDFQMSIYQQLLKHKYQNLEFAYVQILEGGKVVYPKHLDQKYNLLEKIVKEIKDTKTFIANKCDDLQECKYCDYILLCKRGEYL